MQEPGHQLFSDSVLGELMLNKGTVTETEAVAVLDKMGLAGLETAIRVLCQAVSSRGSLLVWRYVQIEKLCCMMNPQAVKMEII